ncbi:MAG: hypothetical protein ACLGHC_00165 [Alphaproteobacteria bacterium]
MAETPQSLTHEELHDLVWETPMRRLAERFGISDVGLKKICRKLDVPTPPVGWWAKKTARKTVKVKPLPEWRPGVPKQVTIAPTPDQEGGLRDAVRERAASLGEISVPERLARPHPLISGWIADHRQRQQEARTHRDRWPGSRFAVPDFTAGERRRHRVLHALFRSLVKHGATISENDRRQLVATIEGEAIAFTCREKLRQVTRPLTDDEKRWETSNSSGVKKDLEPTGMMELQIHARLDEPLRKTWRESESKPIEAMLPEIVAIFLVLGPVLAERSRRREEEARIAAERHRIAELERQRRQQDDNRFRRLCEIADGWKRVELARAFLARLRESELPETDPIDGRSLAEWLDWAEAKAAALDPAEQGTQAIFADVAQVNAWTYRD